MLKKASENLTEKLLRYKIIETDNKQYYLYGIELLLIKMVFYLSVFSLAIITNTIWSSIFFIFSFITLRQYTGGYHCHRFWKCFLLSMLIYIIMILIALNLKNEMVVFFIVLALLASFIIVLRAPLNNVNKPLDVQEWKKYQMISIILVICYLCSIFIGWQHGLCRLTVSISWALVADAGLILIHDEKEMRKNEKENTQSNF